MRFNSWPNTDQNKGCGNRSRSRAASNETLFRRETALAIALGCGGASPSSIGSCTSAFFNRAPFRPFNKSSMLTRRAHLDVHAKRINETTVLKGAFEHRNA